MRRDIDLHHVAAEHAAIHERLTNWGRWSNPRSRAALPPSPIFRLYEPYLVPRDNSTPSDVDPLDAQAVQKVMHKLPGIAPHLLAWVYVHPYISAGKVCRRLGINMRELADRINWARTCVRNVLQTS